MADDADTWIEDQADLDQQTEEEYRARREKELRRRSQAVQRDLPRPTDMNDSVLRPLNSDPPLTELQGGNSIDNWTLLAKFCQFFVQFVHLA